MNDRRLTWFGFGLLALFLMALGICLVPAHLVSIWMDPEFTDWISPIANRLHGGARLYGDGLHSPMPPLPYVLLRFLHPNGATWMHESVLHWFFQSAMVLLLYHTFKKQVGPLHAFLASLAAMAVFFCLTKSILYDSMAQFLVVACAVVAESLTRFKPGGAAPARIDWLRLALLGSLMSLLMLTKQSTGTGVFLGVTVSIALLPEQLTLRQRLLNVVALLIFSGLAFCIISLAISPFINFPGMVRDVFLIGSEPKGGNKLLIYVIGFFIRTLVLTAAAVTGFFIVGGCLNRASGWRSWLGTFESLFVKPTNHADEAGRDISSSRQVWCMVAVSLVAAGSFLILYRFADQNAVARLHTLLKEIPNLKVLYLGLNASAYLGVMMIIRRLGKKAGSAGHHPLTIYVLIFLPAAMFHSLSVSSFRWTYDNNPLITLAFVFMLSPLLFAPATGRISNWRINWPLRVTAICVVMLLYWQDVDRNLGYARQCNQSWPEIPHLAGARLRPDTAGMRALVQQVKTLTGEGGTNTVLLLPNDPNVEAWFDRPRPPVSSAIIFTDQYWDRYVDKDLATLFAHPPKVIVVGPRNFWRKFSRRWNLNWGAERLIDRVNTELLQKDYDLRVEQPIKHAGLDDFMDVYVRRAP